MPACSARAQRFAPYLPSRTQLRDKALEGRIPIRHEPPQLLQLARLALHLRLELQP